MSAEEIKPNEQYQSPEEEYDQFRQAVDQLADDCRVYFDLDDVTRFSKDYIDGTNIIYKMTGEFQDQKSDKTHPYIFQFKVPYNPNNPNDSNEAHMLFLSFGKKTADGKRTAVITDTSNGNESLSDKDAIIPILKILRYKFPGLAEEDLDKPKVNTDSYI